MKKYVFATNNAHKLEEVKDILGDKIELLSMKDINCQTDIPETADTLAGNALIKARYIYENYHMDCTKTITWTVLPTIPASKWRH